MHDPSIVTALEIIANNEDAAERAESEAAQYRAYADRREESAVRYRAIAAKWRERLVGVVEPENGAA